MKIRSYATLLIVLLMTFLFVGCSARTVAGTLDTAEDAVEQHLEAVENKIEKTILPQPAAPAAPATQLTPEEAQAIALKHANLTADQVSRLHTEFEIDDRIPHYDIQFHHESWEYEYEIHGETGDILSFDKDD